MSDAPARAPAAPSPASSHVRPEARPYVLAATILASAMGFIDSSVVVVALPAIQQDFGAAMAQLQWTLSGYTLMMGALVLTGGALGDRYGRRRIFDLGVLLFALASIACALAPSVESLIVARLAQGLGAALLTPGSLSILAASFPREIRGKAFGTWAGAAAITTAAGPLVGGWMIDNLSWRAIFYINVPLSAVVLWLSWRTIPESRDLNSAKRLDVWGAGLAVLGFGLLTYGLIASGERGFLHLGSGGVLLAGLAAIVVFLAVEASLRQPMMPLHLFRSADFSGVNALTVFLYFALGGALFLLPFNLIQIHGYSATAAGAAFLPFALLIGVLSRFAGTLIQRLGARRLLTAGPLVAGCGFLAHALVGTEGSYWTTFFPGMVLMGLGMACVVTPLTTTVMNAVDDRYAGLASGISNAAARVASLLAVAVLGTLAVLLFEPALAERLAARDLPAELSEGVLARATELAGLTAPAEATPAEARAVRGAVEEAFVSAFRAAMLTIAGLAVLAATLAWFTISDRPISDRPAPQEPRR
jgi:EmrB/QacA subfamily drug resistance transporter